MISIDARGLSCPEPLVLLHKALPQQAPCYQVLVDNATAKENVSAFALNRGFHVDVEVQGDDYCLTLTRQ